MPVIAHGAVRSDSVGIAGALARRHWSRDDGNSPISSTALGFLIPVFVVLFFAPILCVFCVRRRRRSSPAPSRPRKPPPLNREEAREKVKAVTEVTKIASDKNKTSQVEEKEKAIPESASILDKECAICLSTLHAPSPPEPAKLAQPELSDTATTASIPSLSTPDREEILRLKVCAHEFHAECLVSWFELRKTSCPICRAVYNEEAEKTEEGVQAPGTTDVEVQTSARDEVVYPVILEGRVSYWHYFWTGRDREPRRDAAGPSG